MPKAIAIFEKEETLYFMTVGASQLPQPKLEQYAPELVEYVLIEFGLALSKQCVFKVGLERVMRAFMDLVAIPWHMLTFFAPGVTCEFDLFENLPEYQKYTKAILLEQTKKLPKITLSHGASHLWFFPISEEEFASKERDFSEATRLL